MADLSFDGGEGVLHDEATSLVHDTLMHYRFLHDFVKRNDLRKEAVEIGWSWYTMYPWEGEPFLLEQEHVDACARMMGLPVTGVDIVEGHLVMEGEIRLESYETGEPIEASEEDLIVTLYGPKDALLRMAEALRFDKEQPRLADVGATLQDDEEPLTLAERFDREDGEGRGNFSVLYPSMAMEPWVIYDKLIPLLERFWRAGRRED